MARRRPRWSYANVVSTVALVMALSGGSAAFAAVIVHSNGDVAKNVISGHQPPGGVHPNLIGHTINGQDLANGAVTGGKIAPNAVAAGDLRSQAVVAGDLAPGAVGAGELQSGAVVAGDIATGAVDGTDLASNAIVCSVTDSLADVAGRCGANSGVSFFRPSTGVSCWFLPFTPAGGAVTIDAAAPGFPVAFLTVDPTEIAALGCTGDSVAVTTYNQAGGVLTGEAYHAVFF